MSGIEPQGSNESEEEPQIVTILDVLKQQQELEDESAAVLGGSDEKQCTYEKGYIKRQALYSCLTCCPEGRNDEKKAAGICLACSYQCHENHELIELYTKRNFRCDCPTERIPNKKCTFVKDSEESNNSKYPENTENKYSQNFRGVYCVCKRPYPDPEDPIEDVMIQCILCEDWYHGRHLDTSTNPSSDMYSEMTCGRCMEACSFLKDYTDFAIDKVENSENDKDVNVTEDDDKLKSELDKSISDIMSISKSSVEETASTSTESEESCNKKAKLDLSIELCKKPSQSNSNYVKGAVFWMSDWRNNLCSCQNCVKIYTKHKVEFLNDLEDTCHYYEENGLKKVRESDYERGIRALSSMDRVKQIETITEYQLLKNKLIEFLRSFVVNQEVVTPADISRFFEGMRNERIKEGANAGVQHFCR